MSIFFSNCLLSILKDLDNCLPDMVLHYSKACLAFKCFGGEYLQISNRDCPGEKLEASRGTTAHT